MIAALPVAFVAPVVAQLAAEFRALHDDGHLRGLTDSIAGGFAKLALLYLLVATAGMIPFARFLHVPIWSVPFVGLIAGVALFVNSLRAIAQGTQDFVGYGFSNAAEGIAKVIGIVALIALGLRLGGAVIGFLVGPLCAPVSYTHLRKPPKQPMIGNEGVVAGVRRCPRDDCLRDGASNLIHLAGDDASGGGKAASSNDVAVALDDPLDRRVTENDGEIPVDHLPRLDHD